LPLNGEATYSFLQMTVLGFLYLEDVTFEKDARSLIFDELSKLSSISVLSNSEYYKVSPNLIFVYLIVGAPTVDASFEGFD
jgi:hypothetical protein